MLKSDSCPLVFLAGTLCDAQLWQAVIEKTSIENTLCLNLQGAKSAEQMAKKLLEQLPERFVLCGFSLGAIVALHIQAIAPKRIAGLACISANPFLDKAENFDKRMADLNHAKEAGFESLIDRLWPQYVSPANQSNGEIKNTIISMAKRCGTEVFDDQTHIAIERHNHLDALKKLDVPVLVISGADDKMCPAKNHEAILNAAPNAKWFEIASCGHFAPLESADIVSQHIVSWMTEIRNA